MIYIYFDEVNYIFENSASDSKVIKLTFSDNKIVSNSICIQHDSIIQMMQEGYRQTKEVMSFVFANGLDDLEFIHSRIAEINALNSNNRTMRITSDVIVTNLNKLAKKIVRHTKVAEGGIQHE